MTARDGVWLVVRIVSPSAESHALLSEGLFASGATAIEEEGAALRTWLPVRGDPAAEIEVLRNRLEAATAAPVVIEWELQADQDWLAKWREGLGPRRIGRRLVVAPTWTPVEAEPDDIVIAIDPQMAFGTGEHASTRGILRLLEDAVPTGARVLDIGTGSAVLAIASIRLGAAHVRAVDMDADALINAVENIERNGVANRVTLEQAAVDEAWLAARPAVFDVIVANVLSGVLLPLLPAFHNVIRGEGALLLAGILQSEAESMRIAGEAAGFRLDRDDREEEWWSGRFHRLQP